MLPPCVNDRVYAIVPIEEGKEKLFCIERPLGNDFKERDFAANAKGIVAYVVPAEGL